MTAFTLTEATNHRPYWNWCCKWCWANLGQTKFSCLQQLIANAVCFIQSVAYTDTILTKMTSSSQRDRLPASEQNSLLLTSLRTQREKKQSNERASTETIKFGSIADKHEIHEQRFGLVSERYSDAIRHLTVLWGPAVSIQTSYHSGRRLTEH